MRRCFRAMSLLLVSVTALSAVADEGVTREKVDRLVDRLASTNSAPIDGRARDGVASYPADYDRDTQKAVIEAGRELHAMGRSALPFLCEHFDDKRYSLTDDAGAAERNYAVGDICFEIMMDHLQPYGRSFTAGERDPRRRRLRPSFEDRFKLRSPKSAKRWLDVRKDKPLRDLQIETLEWVIQEEAKKPELFQQEERDFLGMLLKGLKDDDKPLDPTPWRFARVRAKR